MISLMTKSSEPEKDLIKIRRRLVHAAITLSQKMLQTTATILRSSTQAIRRPLSVGAVRQYHQKVSLPSVYSFQSQLC